MDVSAAASLISTAIPGGGGTWADLGAGTGTFTRALASLVGPAGRVHAVERDLTSIGTLRKAARRASGGAEIIVVMADFLQPLELPELDGVLLANALHYVETKKQAAVLQRIVRLIRPEGRLVIVEYDGRGPNRWVPYPVSLARFRDLAAELGLTAPRTAGEAPSAFGGTMYAAYSELRNAPV